MTNYITCKHAYMQPVTLNIQARNSGEIVAEITVRLCPKCGHHTGFARNGSLFNPSGDLPISVPDGGSLQKAALVALGLW